MTAKRKIQFQFWKRRSRGSSKGRHPVQDHAPLCCSVNKSKEQEEGNEVAICFVFFCLFVVLLSVSEMGQPRPRPAHQLIRQVLFFLLFFSFAFSAFSGSTMDHDGQHLIPVSYLIIVIFYAQQKVKGSNTAATLDRVCLHELHFY